jgi:nucleotide sugar dehydrogenase
MSYEKIGIIGYGYVGEAVAQSVIPPLQAIIIDPAKGYNATYSDIKKECTTIFVCVPSPQDANGECDTSILEDVLENLRGYNGTIISKVTAPPKFYEEQAKRFPNLVYIPEFLRASTHFTDFANAKWLIVGGTIGAYQRDAIRICKLLQPETNHIELCGIGEAAFVKYSINSFLALKVVFMNELHQLAVTHDYEWKHLAYLIKMDERVGHSHTQVPGPDGHYGFGGACFPKDTNALLKYAESLGVNLNTLDAAVKKNTLLRLTQPK